MMFDGLTNGLRWVFWGCAYLLVLLTALMLVVVMMPLPLPMRIAMMLVFVWGVALDVHRKLHPEPA